MEGGLQDLQGQAGNWHYALKETPVTRIIEVNPIPVEVFLLEKRASFSCSKAPNFLGEIYWPVFSCGHKTKEIIVESWHFWRSTVISRFSLSRTSEEAEVQLLTSFHPSSSKMTSEWILSTLIRSRSTPIAQSFRPRREDGRPDFHETSLCRCLSSSL